MYLQSRPGAVLAGHIEKLWYCDGYAATHRQERVLPNGHFQLIIDLARPPGSLVVGMHTRYNILETTSVQHVMGVVFRPGGARVFFDPPADEFLNCSVPLDEVWRSGTANLRDLLLEEHGPMARLRALEADLERRLGRVKELRSVVRYAIGAFGRSAGSASVLTVARDTGLSRRRFAELFREQVGLTPKMYCRLRRFQSVVRTVASAAPIDWTQIALENGYYDQAHMAHEFREFSGIAPGAWSASERPFLNHAVIQ
jgi:AraC-like DNA-binding protein